MTPCFLRPTLKRTCDIEADHDITPSLFSRIADQALLLQIAYVVVVSDELDE